MIGDGPSVRTLQTLCTWKSTCMHSTFCMHKRQWMNLLWWRNRLFSQLCHEWSGGKERYPVAYEKKSFRSDSTATKPQYPMNMSPQNYLILETCTYTVLAESSSVLANDICVCTVRWCVFSSTVYMASSRGLYFHWDTILTEQCVLTYNKQLRLTWSNTWFSDF